MFTSQFQSVFWTHPWIAIKIEAVSTTLRLRLAGMEMDRICMESDLDVTFYHILIRIYTDTNILEYKYKMDASDSDFY